MRQEIRVNFTGTTTLDNGITVGVLVGLNGENTSYSGSQKQIDRAYADFSGKFGMIRVGEANSALLTECVTDPGNVTSNFGVNSPNESFSDVGYGAARNQLLGVQTTFGGTPLTNKVSSSFGNTYHSTFGPAPAGSIGTCYGIEPDRGNKIMYFSPSFGGFTFGVSFSPQAGSRLAGGGKAYGTNNDVGFANMLSVGADYVHDFGGWNLTVGGGGEWAFTKYTGGGGSGASNKPSMYQAGIQVGIGHFAVGASGAYYVNYGNYYTANTASSGDDGWVATVGGSYTIDAWSFGLQGIYGDYQQSGAALTGLPFVSADDYTYWGVSLNGAYALGPGISLEGQVAYTQGDYGNLSAFGVSVPVPTVVGVNANTVHSWEIDLGTAINF